MTDNIIERVAKVGINKFDWVGNEEFAGSATGDCYISHGSLTNDGLRVLEDRLLKAGWHPFWVDRGYGWGAGAFYFVEGFATREQAAMTAYLSRFEDTAR